MPDSGVAGDADLAASSGVVLLVAASKKRQRLGRSSTYWHLRSYLNALMFYIPAKSFSPWLSSIDRVAEDSTLQVDKASGFTFSWSDRKREGVWQLPRPL